MEYFDDTSQLCRTGHDDVSRTKIRALALILFELSPFDAFYAYSCPLYKLEYPFEYNHDTSQLCRTKHDDVSRTRMTALAFILSDLFPLDVFRCNFVSAPLLENRLENNHDTSQFCRTGHDNALRTRMTTLAFIVSELSPLDGFICNFVSAP